VIATYDCEVYRNYFLIMVVFEDGNMKYYERHNDVESGPMMEVMNWFNYNTMISFNGRNYDDQIIGYWLTGATNSELKNLSDRIILGTEQSFMISQSLGYQSISNPYVLQQHEIQFIDIMNVLPLQASLKIYGARIHSDKLQELPIDPSDDILNSQCEDMREYCHNDNLVTWDLYRKIEPQIDLRIKMGHQFPDHKGDWFDYRSLSDAQIAERIYKEEFHRINHKPIPWGVERSLSDYTPRYEPPAFIEFIDDKYGLPHFLEQLKAEHFELQSSFYVMTPEILLAPNPKELKTRKPREIQIADKAFKVGLGGLHSVDKPGTWYEGAATRLIDIDVTAYYPNIILRSGLYPKSLGPMFLDIYKRLVDMRVEAKRSGDKVMDAGLKITINGTFGKLGSKYACIFAPDLLLHITLTGQLCLLMLIEKFAQAGIPVVSANTDGITIVDGVDHQNPGYYQHLVEQWEDKTGFNMEYTHYRSVHMRDVNNYIAIKEDGTAKRKGAYASASVGTNPVSQICTEAVVQYLIHGTSVVETIGGCDDFGQFVTVRTCRAGATWNDEYIGKALRWYYSTADNRAPLLSVKNGNKVAKSDNCKPCLDLPEVWPLDLDLHYYINEANKMLQQLKVFL